MLIEHCLGPGQKPIHLTGNPSDPIESIWQNAERKIPITMSEQILTDVQRVRKLGRYFRETMIPSLFSGYLAI